MKKIFGDGFTNKGNGNVSGGNNNNNNGQGQSFEYYNEQMIEFIRNFVICAIYTTESSKKCKEEPFKKMIEMMKQEKYD